MSLQRSLRDGVIIACENSPSSTTISGDLDQRKKVVETIKAEKLDVLARELKVDMAYDSREYYVPQS
jgi:acyl transferase domain-containing protein